MEWGLGAPERKAVIITQLETMGQSDSLHRNLLSLWEALNSSQNNSHVNPKNANGERSPFIPSFKPNNLLLLLEQSCSWPWEGSVRGESKHDA